jgi:hypothetical protein
MTSCRHRAGFCEKLSRRANQQKRRLGRGRVHDDHRQLGSLPVSQSEKNLHQHRRKDENAQASKRVDAKNHQAEWRAPANQVSHDVDSRAVTAFLTKSSPALLQQADMFSPTEH